MMMIQTTTTTEVRVTNGEKQEETFCPFVLAAMACFYLCFFSLCNSLCLVLPADIPLLLPCQTTTTTEVRVTNGEKQEETFCPFVLTAMACFYLCFFSLCNSLCLVPPADIPLLLPCFYG
jgi:hypothetical protein